MAFMGAARIVTALSIGALGGCLGLAGLDEDYQLGAPDGATGSSAASGSGASSPSASGNAASGGPSGSGGATSSGEGGTGPAAGGSGGAPSWQVIDTLTVPAMGQVVVSNVTLQNGVTYRLQVSGTFTIHDSGTLADAEYADFAVLYDEIAGVDLGLAVDDPSVDAEKIPDWGSFQRDHVYLMEWMGRGATIDAQIHDANYTNNSGSLTLEILAFQ
jgi:hypothetical protein